MRLGSVVLVLFAVLACTNARLFTDNNNLWNVDVSTWDVHPNSTGIQNFLDNTGGWDGAGGGMRLDFSMIVNFVDASTHWVDVFPNATGYNYAECDDLAGFQFPLPSVGAVEGGTISGNYSCQNFGNDCHLLVVDQANGMLYESYESNFNNGKLQSSCIVQWNLCHVYGLSGRGEQCTSTDAGGLSVAAGVPQVSEVADGTLDHAIRFILWNGQIGDGPDQGQGGTKQYVHPANHVGGPQSTNVFAPPYGTRWRLKANFNLTGFPAPIVTIGNALKKFGLILTDGDNKPAFGITLENDPFSTTKWGDLGIGQHTLNDYGFTVDSFEVVKPPDYPTVITYNGNCNKLAVPTDPCSITTGTTTSGDGDGDGDGGGGGGNAAASLESVVRTVRELL